MVHSSIVDSLGSEREWLRLALGLRIHARLPEAAVDDSEVLGSCPNRTEADLLSEALSDPHVDIHADPELGLAVRLKGESLGSDCPAAWSLAYLHWAEQLARAVLASPLLAESRALEALLLRDLRRLVRRAWHLFRSSAASKALQVSQWPAYAQRLRRIARELQSGWPVLPKRAVGAILANITATTGGGSEILTLFCGGLRAVDTTPLAQAAENFGWQLEVLMPMAAANSSRIYEAPQVSGKAWLFDACVRAYELRAQTLEAKFGVVLMWSPLLEAWEMDAELRAHTFWNINALALRMLTPENTWSVVGFPSFSSKGLVWPVRRLRWQYWKLHYFEGPSGHAGVDDDCFLGDSTSATRLVTASTLKAAGFAGGGTWLSAIDLAVLRRSPAERLPGVVTCPTVITYEEDWLQHVRLNRLFAVTHHVEAAHWTGSRSPPIDELCIALSADVAQQLVKHQGVVVPWCFRKHLYATIDRICQWWQQRSAANVVGVATGTMLALMRGGRPMPWDHDADLFLVSRQPLEVHQQLDDITAELAKLGCSFWTGGIAEEGFLCAKATCTSESGVVAAVDLFIQGGEDELLLRARVNQDWGRHTEADLLKSRVQFDTSTFLGMAMNPEYGPKLMRTAAGLRPLHCLASGHNACLPDCREGKYCEFKDNFVLIDSWPE